MFEFANLCEQIKARDDRIAKWEKEKALPAPTVSPEHAAECRQLLRDMVNIGKKARRLNKQIREGDGSGE